MGNRQWKTLDWLPGYEISEDGDVRRTTRSHYFPIGYVLKGCLCEGYRTYQVRTPTGRRVLKAHRLVCEAFHGPPPDGKREAAHNDGNKANNHFTNLRWASRRENHNDRIAHGTDPSGERNGQAKLTWDKVREIRRAWDGTSKHIRVLARQYSISRHTMGGVCRGKSWK